MLIFTSFGDLLVRFQSPYGDFGTLTRRSGLPVDFNGDVVSVPLRGFWYSDTADLKGIRDAWKEVSVPLRGFWYSDSKFGKFFCIIIENGFSPLTGILVL